MRDLAFRAWFPETKVMSVDFTLEDALKHEVDYVGECIFLQYTGLKDKNGRKIFEGDIVQHFDEVLQVIYLEDEARFYAISNFGLKEHLEIGAKISSETVKNIEVIGNIYKNPELYDSNKKD